MQSSVAQWKTQLIPDGVKILKLSASTNPKTRYILKQRELGGVFMWELSADDDGRSQDLLNSTHKAWQTAR